MNLSPFHVGLTGPTPVPRQAVEKLMRDSISKELKDATTTNACPPGFVGNSSCQANLISFFEEVQSLVDKGNILVWHLTFCMALDLVPNSVLILKKHHCMLSVTHTFNGLRAGELTDLKSGRQLGIIIE